MIKEKNKKMVKVTEADYLRMRRDQKTKREVKRIARELLDKTKNWK